MTARRTLTWAWTAILALAACASEGPADKREDTGLGALLKDPTAWEGTAGFRADAGHEISRVVDAQFSRGDASVWVVDNVPPFVRRFSFEGRQLLRFVGRGDGPGEARSVASLAVNDSLVALVHDGLISLYRHDGSPLATRIRLPVIPERIGEGCGGAWLISGRTASSAGVYVLDISPNGEPTVTRLVADTTGGAMHGPRRFHMDRQQYLIFHTRKEPRTFSAGVCGEPGLVHLATAPPENISETWSAETGERRTIRVRYRPNSRRVTGFARMDDRVLFSFLTASGSTIALHSVSGMEHEVFLPDLYDIHDARGGRVLIGVRYPTPGVLLVSARRILELLALDGASKS